MPSGLHLPTVNAVLNATSAILLTLGWIAILNRRITQHRICMTAAFMTAITISNALGSPISGAIMQGLDGVHGWRGWQWLFLLEGIPSVVLGFVVLLRLDDGPRRAAWLTDEQRELVLERLAEDEQSKQGPDHRHHFADDRFGRIGAAGHDGRDVIDLDTTGHPTTPFLTLCGVVCPAPARSGTGPPQDVEEPRASALHTLGRFRP